MWQQYVDGGGVAADDARYLQRIKEEQAKSSEARRSTTPSIAAGTGSTRLIEVSPKKESVSRNADLLIDLDLDVAPAAEPRPQSYANAVTTTKGRSVTHSTMSLLD